MKVFGSYGKFYDIMKLNLAISSFGGQYWNNCYYALDTPDLTLDHSRIEQRKPLLRRPPTIQRPELSGRAAQLQRA